MKDFQPHGQHGLSCTEFYPPLISALATCSKVTSLGEDEYAISIRSGKLGLKQDYE